MNLRIDEEKRKCRVCGCTWNNPCIGGCYWTEYDLCSNCQKTYSQEDKELNMELKKLQNRAKRLILDDYYNFITLGELEYGILKQVTNAKSHYDIAPHVWNSGVIEKTLDIIAKKLKRGRKK